VGLLLIAIAAAGVGRQELFNLAAEDPARSVHRFATGAAEVEVATQLPWSRVPAVLPGPADAWAGGSAHAVAVHLALPVPRDRLLYVHTSRTRPAELPVGPASTGDSSAHLRVVVNGMSVAGFDAPAIGGPPAPKSPRAPPRIKIAIPATVQGPAATLTIALVNDGGAGVVLRRVRLIEARPSFSPARLIHDGRFPVVSAMFLAAGLGLLLWTRLLPGGDGLTGHSWRRAAGPGLGLLLLGVAVAAPSVTRSVPRAAWLLLILLLLPMGRGGPRPAAAHRPPSAVLARAAGNALLGIVAVAVSLVAGELALRTAFRDEPWVRSALHVPAPGPPKQTPLNSLGFDEREVSLEKPPAVYRIAILGDSLSVSAPRAERFGSVIADHLNAHGPRPVTYEAVSFGRAGADTNHETEILQQAVWRTSPDFVLLEFYVNDLENGDHSGRPRGSSLISGDSWPARWLRRVTDRTLLRRRLEAQFDILQERLGLVETYPAYMHRQFGDPAGAHWEAAAYELRDFIRECRAHDTPLAIALFPHLSAGLPAGSYEFAELHDQVLELCRAESVPCVDLRSTFAAYRNYTSLWVDRFDPHPNALAHRLAAERLLEVLGPLWLDVGRGPGAAGPAALQPRRPTGFLSVPIPSIVMLTTSPGASAQASGTRMPVPVESTVPGGTGL
jgi:lysophospholipase L1-like esterase